VKLPLVIAMLTVLVSCAPHHPDDVLVERVRAIEPSVVLLQMKVPPEKKSDGYDDAYGTGFVIASGSWGSDILTAAHVVDGAWDLTATIDNRTKLPAKILKVNDDKDLALLRVMRPNLPPLVIPHARDLSGELGRDVAVIGYPVPDEFEDEKLGLATSIATGVLSSLRNDAVEVALPIIPGESGGPVFLVDSGEIIGVADSRFDDEHAIGFAVPVADITAFLASAAAPHRSSAQAR
jgi:S1-C subfamily serine protease